MCEKIDFLVSIINCTIMSSDNCSNSTNSDWKSDMLKFNNSTAGSCDNKDTKPEVFNVFMESYDNDKCLNDIYYNCIINDDPPPVTEEY